MQPAPQDEIVQLKIQIERLSKQLDLQKDFASLRQQVEFEISRLKWIGATIGLLVSFLGFFGFKAWKDLTDAAQAAFTKQIGQLSDQTFDLARGFVLADAHRYREAIPYLSKSHDRNPFDESVASALIDALINDGDYLQALRVVEELRAEPKRYREITSALLSNNIGRVLIFYGIDKPEYLDEAERVLQKSLRTFAPDAYSSKYTMFNLFRLSILKGDWKRAEQYLAGAYRIDKQYGTEAYTADSWYRKLRDKRPDAFTRMQKIIAKVALDR